MHKAFDLTGRVAIITGGAGLLGKQHAQAIASAGGIPVILDIAAEARGYRADVTNRDEVQGVLDKVLERFGRVDILINNAANNPKMEAGADKDFSRFEHFPVDQWNRDLSVGIGGAFVCSQIFGPKWHGGAQG